MAEADYSSTHTGLGEEATGCSSSKTAKASTTQSQPRRTASIAAMSIFFICIIASNARFAAAGAGAVTEPSTVRGTHDSADGEARHLGQVRHYAGHRDCVIAHDERKAQRDEADQRV